MWVKSKVLVSNVVSPCEVPIKFYDGTRMFPGPNWARGFLARRVESGGLGGGDVDDLGVHEFLHWLLRNGVEAMAIDAEALQPS